MATSIKYKEDYVKIEFALTQMRENGATRTFLWACTVDTLDAVTDGLTKLVKAVKEESNDTVEATANFSRIKGLDIQLKYLNNRFNNDYGKDSVSRIIDAENVKLMVNHLTQEVLSTTGRMSSTITTV